MKFYFVTLFPETIDVWLSTSIPGRAHKNGVFEYEMVRLRDFGIGPRLQVDDSSYGGGGGMVMGVQPLVEACESVIRRLPPDSYRTIYFSPAGQKLDHRFLRQCHAKSEIQHYILICGHYEGVDQRF